jgi:DHA1 family quinolone resistance protein-like MFS transporter
MSAYGILSPVLAIFLTDQVAGGSLLVVGIAEAIYLGTKSILQIPFGVLIDNTQGQKIDFWFLFIGNLIMSCTLFFYLWAGAPWHIYLISAIYGIGDALAYPAWTGLFTRNMVADKESFAWSYSTTIAEIGSAGAALLGGVIAQFLGFRPLFAIVGSLSLFGTFLLFVFYDELKNT